MADKWLTFQRVDASKLEDMVNALSDLSAAQKELVLPRTINEVLDRAFTITKRTLAQETGAATARVGQFLRKIPARQGSPKAAIQAKGEFFSLKDFKPKPNAMGKPSKLGGVQTGAWGGRKVLKGSFIGPGEHVYKRMHTELRTPKRGAYKGRRYVRGPKKGQPIKRQLIKKMWGPAVPLEMVRGRSMAAIVQLIETDGARLMQSQVDRILKRIKRDRRV